MLLFYKFARYFIPGFHSDNVKNGIKLVRCWGNVNMVNDISKNIWETLICPSFSFQTFGSK